MSANADDIIPPSALIAPAQTQANSPVDDIIPPSALAGPVDLPKTAQKSWFARKMDAESNAFPVGAALVGAGSGALTDIGATGAVLRGLFSGNVKSLSDASRISEQYETDHPPYTPPENSGAWMLGKMMGSPYNPINYPSDLIGKGGDLVSKGLEAAGAPSSVSTAAGPIAVGAGQVAIGAIGAAKGLGIGKGEPIGTAAPGAAPNAAGSAVAAFDSPPVEGGVPDAAQDARSAVLQRIGLENARPSAIAGDAKAAATDWQLSKLDEPLGVQAKAQFDAEKTALTTHAQSIVDDTGGTTGTDEDTLNDRGRTIAAPFDALRDWFTGQKKGLYDTALQRGQNSPIGEMTSTESLLKDPDFTEQLLAKDQGGLLSSIQRQYARFKGLNPGGITQDPQTGTMVGDQGMTVTNAENFRKFLNSVWTPQTSKVLGSVKGAVDEDVFRSAGEDVYGEGRALAETEHQVLDDPDGVSDLFDFDPKKPLNRSTAFAKIPDALTRLDPDQFANIIKTLDTMPDELQPQAQAAKSEIQAHLANKLLDAGSSTRGQWNSPAVSKVLKANSAKFQAAFDDKPEVLQKIQDLDSGGRILQTNQSYPGAVAQAANLAKRGALSGMVGKLSGAAGATVGTTVGGLVAGPPGAIAGGAAGAAAGESAGSALTRRMGEASAAKKWSEGLVHLNGLLKTGSPRVGSNNP